MPASARELLLLEPPNYHHHSSKPLFEVSGPWDHLHSLCPHSFAIATWKARRQGPPQRVFSSVCLVRVLREMQSPSPTVTPNWVLFSETEAARASEESGRSSGRLRTPCLTNVCATHLFVSVLLLPQCCSKRLINKSARCLMCLLFLIPEGPFAAFVVHCPPRADVQAMVQWNEGVAVEDARGRSSHRPPRRVARNRARVLLRRRTLPHCHGRCRIAMARNHGEK